MLTKKSKHTFLEWLKLTQTLTPEEFEIIKRGVKKSKITHPKTGRSIYI